MKLTKHKILPFSPVKTYCKYCNRLIPRRREHTWETPHSSQYVVDVGCLACKKQEPNEEAIEFVEKFAYRKERQFENGLWFAGNGAFSSLEFDLIIQRVRGALGTMSVVQQLGMGQAGLTSEEYNIVETEGRSHLKSVMEDLAVAFGFEFHQDGTKLVIECGETVELVDKEPEKVEVDPVTDW